MHRTHWVSVLRWALVLFAEVLPSSCAILFGIGGHGCCFRTTVWCGSIRGNGGDVTTLSSSSIGSHLNGGRLHGGCVRVTLCGVVVSSRTLCGGVASYLLSL